MVNIRPKKEETTVNTAAQVITSDIEKDFTIDIPAGTFEEETVLSLQVDIHVTNTIYCEILYFRIKSSKQIVLTKKISVIKICTVWDDYDNYFRCPNSFILNRQSECHVTTICIFTVPKE